MAVIWFFFKKLIALCRSRGELLFLFHYFRISSDIPHKGVFSLNGVFLPSPKKLFFIGSSPHHSQARCQGQPIVQRGGRSNPPRFSRPRHVLAAYLPRKKRSAVYIFSTSETRSLSGQNATPSIATLTAICVKNINRSTSDRKKWNKNKSEELFYQYLKNVFLLRD